MNEAVARRYASALADVALEQIKADKVKADFSSFVDAFYESADLRNFLETPAVGPEQKHQVIEKLAERMGLDPAVRNFVYLTVDHHRTELLREMEQALADEINARLGIALAQVTSAQRLNEAERQQLMFVSHLLVPTRISRTHHGDVHGSNSGFELFGITHFRGAVGDRRPARAERMAVDVYF